MKGSTAGPRVAVVGLDGATFTLIEPWVREGHLPTFGTLMERGAWGTLRSTIPPLTPPSWTSSVTGVNPGKHNVFDFKVPHHFKKGKEHLYETRVTTSQVRMARPIWEYLNAQGMSVGIIGLPVTYPPEPVDGYIVAGPPTLGSGAFTYPAGLEKEIAREFPGFSLLFDWPRVEELGRGEFLRQLDEQLVRYFDLGEYMLEHHPTDLFMLVFYYLDLLQHKMWRFMDPSHPDHEVHPVYNAAVLEFHKRMDRRIGQMWSRLPPGTPLVVYSDHGHGPHHKEVYLNNWLRDEGYLHLRAAPGARRSRFTADLILGRLQGLRLRWLVRHLPRWLKEAVPETQKSVLMGAIDWPRTRAYVFQPTSQSINLNVRGREPAGVVEPEGGYDALAAELRSKLLALRDPQDGARVVEEVYIGREIYTGPYAAEAPDLILKPAEGYFIEDGFADDVIMARRDVYKGGIKSDRSSYHRINGIFLAAGGPFTPGRRVEASVLDIAPTLLWLAGAPIPDHMEGTLVKEALEPGALALRPPTFFHDRTTVGKALEEAVGGEEIEDRLRSLGYLR